MNKLKVLLFACVFIFGLSLSNNSANAQCAMCSLTAANATENGNTQGKGLNKGILFLLAMPFLAAAGIGSLWYFKYSTKKTVTINDRPISLN